jgi:hypothetical protein
MKSGILLIAVGLLALTCKPVHESEIASNEQEDQPGQTLKKQGASDAAVALDAELENLMLGKLKTSAMSVDSTNEYGAGDCFGKITYCSQGGMGLGIDSMSCGEYGYTYTHYLLNSKNEIQGVYLKQSESLLQTDGNWKYALTERIIDFRNAQAAIMERVDTLDDHTVNSIAKEFEVKNSEDRRSSLELWEVRFKELWEKGESY